MGFKAGANFSDQVRIREMVTEGYSVEEISANLLIELSVVSSFVDADAASEASDSEESDSEEEDE